MTEPSSDQLVQQLLDLPPGEAEAILRRHALHIPKETVKRLRQEQADMIYAALAEPESASLEQGVQQMQPFVVRHYTEDERPTIKGNGFDGLEIGEDREEAEAFVTWINEKLALLGQ